MRNVNVVAVECIGELSSLNIKIGKVNSFTVNYRAEKRWGQCCKKPDGSFEININHRLLDESTEIVGLKSVVMHELLHTCDGCFNHGKLWSYYAEKVNSRYGYTVSRCSSADGLGVAKWNQHKEDYRAKHAWKCCKCGGMIYRQRDMHYEERYRCSCGGNLKKMY